MGSLRIALDRIRSREAVREDLVRSRRRLALERHEADVEAILWKRRAVPRTMEGNERAVTVLGRELRARVEQQTHRGVVGREDRDWLVVLCAVAFHLAIA